VTHRPRVTVYTRAVCGLCRQAEAVLFTHHTAYQFPDILAAAKRRSSPTPVEFFLQHGVTAIKPSMAAYHRSIRPDYSLFNVCSKWEQNLVVRVCGWDETDVVVAGFPRWDSLNERNEAFLAAGGKADRLLVFPTWRSGLDKLSDEHFVHSEFFRRWIGALRGLADRCSRIGMDIDFCAHSIMQRFSSHFAFPGLRCIPVREAIENIPSYEMLLTDYSSLAFDFLVLRKPSVFFMFDPETIYAKAPPYIDLNTELPGPMASTEKALLEMMFSPEGELKRPSGDFIERWRGRYIGSSDASAKS
jgi:hypothetical protein